LKIHAHTKTQRSPRRIKENEIAKIIVDTAYRLHIKLGPGLLESVYEVILTHELGKSG